MAVVVGKLDGLRRMRYWRHERTGEVVAVALDEDGFVVACSDFLPVHEVARQYRTDVRWRPELCQQLNSARKEYRVMHRTQIQALRYRYGSIV